MLGFSPIDKFSISATTIGVAGAGGATANPAGVSATGAVGTISVSGSDVTASTGVSGTGAVGTVGLQISGSTTSVSAAGATGSPIYEILIGPLGVVATGQIGVATVDTGGDASASPTGVFATGTAAPVVVNTVSVVASQDILGKFEWPHLKKVKREKPLHIDWNAIEEKRRAERQKAVRELFFPPEIVEEQAARAQISESFSADIFSESVKVIAPADFYELELLLLLA